MCTQYVPGECEVRRGYQSGNTVMSLHLGVGNRTWVFYKSKCFWLPNHLYRPEYYQLNTVKSLVQEDGLLSFSLGDGYL